MMNFLGIVITIFAYRVAESLKKISALKGVPPILFASFFVIFTVKVFHIDYNTYNESARFLTYLLFPATIALGCPIYKNLKLLNRNKRIIMTAFVLATMIALLSTYFLGEFCHSSSHVVESLLPKSTTAPIAIAISKNLGGIPELTACVVLLTGVFGGVLGHRILKLVKVKNDIAIGLSIGAASHVIGTASCIEKGKEKQIVMSSVAFIVVGILTAIFAPVVLFLCEKLFF